MQNKSIESLIDEDVVYAKVLEQLGVEFYESRDKTLAEITKENNINLDNLLTILEESNSRKSREYLDLRKYPIRLIVAYLKHSHQIFIKDTLSYILKKVAEVENSEDQNLVQDLKMILPMFIEDFIHHIYEEEDRLFTYLSDLEKFVNGKLNTTMMQTRMDKFSVQEFALYHNDSDTEMKGIRDITNNYSTEGISDPTLRLLIIALRQFDEDLVRHANIENDILFAKGLIIEKEAIKLLDSKVGLN
ncbi:iron-sulfur cluster repair di-iron protein [Reichenbachiella versicolor]|uniref:iron-sulfur cluster repair di-iron protein n=1 Tax=Reichenbachiella versicolor TaxID=1821036 RepID=UPI000D6E673C|nr:iron-sulfur cluster repair di-iron protein [Reichenbachiella versicolor]